MSRIIKNATLKNIDCMEYMKSVADHEFDLAIVDPPYAWNSGNVFTSRLKKYGDVAYNEIRPSSDFFKELKRCSKNQIIFCGNYFISDLEDTRCMVIWDKRQPIKTYARVEIAWTSFKDRHSELIDLQYFGSTGSDIQRCHPNQKPVRLYEEILLRFAQPGMKILDTHFGSGSIAIACNNLGFDLVATEIDKKYYESAIQRIESSSAQDRLFI